jgi:hypothetical protein
MKPSQIHTSVQSQSTTETSAYELNINQLNIGHGKMSYRLAKWNITAPYMCFQTYTTKAIHLKKIQQKLKIR